MSTAQSSSPKVSLSEINLSNPEFWLQDRAWRNAAFKTLRDEAPYQFFEEWEFEDSPIPRGPGYYSLLSLIHI